MFFWQSILKNIYEYDVWNLFFVKGNLKILDRFFDRYFGRFFERFLLFWLIFWTDFEQIFDRFLDRIFERYYWGAFYSMIECFSKINFKHFYCPEPFLWLLLVIFMIESAPRFGVESSFFVYGGVWCYPLSRSIHLEHKALNKWGENSFFSTLDTWTWQCVTDFPKK